MAVDFSLLPKEEPEPDDPPSRPVWMAFFVVTALGVALAIVLLWPRQLSTHTWKFWASLILFPVGIPAWIVLRRYSICEGRRLDVLMRNEAIRKYNERVHAIAARPLAIVGTAFRFSSDRKENNATAVQTGAVRLATQEPIASDGNPIKARWLTVPGVKLRPGGKEADDARHRQLTRWLYEQLLDDLANRIRLIPSRINLGVCLWVSGRLTRHEYMALWQECWRERHQRKMRILEQTEPAGLATLDNWLDRVASGSMLEAKLIVAIHLYPLLSDTPPVGAAEAGVALLLMPGELARQHAVVHEATVSRPVRGPLDQSNGALPHALAWGAVTAAEIAASWQTGLGPVQTGVLCEAAVRLGLNTQSTDLDQTVGHAATAAPWLAIACAAEAPSASMQSQIVFAGLPDGADVAVVRWVERDPV
ncbi:hypothetical protein [Cupriavidus sp. AcVe19-6a]|uniref:hypothetical protein n=1 Tax=Cupriavidus sp. AcVe19-6a TaxID=2821358 RepID=UPI001AE67C43|nr:hypothetical protein [Cupriavidus sp. AcVe19-6a]MBP0639248.1 hypothetical protein [Cupriavidus sp. AcVe19-6a]